MKNRYPIIVSKLDEGVLIYVPGLELSTYGPDVEEAKKTTVEAISFVAKHSVEFSEGIPDPSSQSEVRPYGNNSVVDYVDVDFGDFGTVK